MAAYHLLCPLSSVGSHSSTLPPEAQAQRLPAHWAGLAGDDARPQTERNPGRRDGSGQDDADDSPAGPSGLREGELGSTSHHRPNVCPPQLGV